MSSPAKSCARSNSRSTDRRRRCRGTRPVGLRPARRRGVMTATKNRPRTSRYMCRALKAPSLAASWNDSRNGPAPKAGPMRSSSPRASNVRSRPAKTTAARSVSAPHGSRPARRSRTSTTTFQRSLKRDQVAHLGTLDFVAERSQRRVPRTARHRQDPPRDRDLDPGLPSRPPRRVRDRRRMGRTPRRRAHPGPTPRRAPPPRPHARSCRRRSRLHPLRSRSREPVLPTRLVPLRTRQLIVTEQAVRPLGRSVRRRRRRRRHDRPARPPRRSHQPQRLPLPTAISGVYRHAAPRRFVTD